MPADRVRPSRIRAEQDRALSRFITAEVHPYSVFNRARLEASGLGRTGVRRQEDLARLAPIALTDADAALMVLRPDVDRVIHFGPRRQSLEMRWARLTGRTDRLVQATLDPDFKPVRWTLADGVPIGATARDVERLADLGRRSLELAGVRPDDVIVGTTSGAASTAFWQLASGARLGGVPALFLPPDTDPDAVARLHPTVLVGSADDLAALLRDIGTAHARLPELRTVIVAGPVPTPARREELADLAVATGGWRRDGGSQPAIVAAWAPEGTRAVWAECRGGDGFHTWPHTEVVQVVDHETLERAEGRLTWSPIGWRGSVLLRLDAGIDAAVDRSPCPTCGRTSPRVRLL